MCTGHYQHFYTLFEHTHTAAQGNKTHSHSTRNHMTYVTHREPATRARHAARAPHSSAPTTASTRERREPPTATTASHHCRCRSGDEKTSASGRRAPCGGATVLGTATTAAKSSAGGGSATRLRRGARVESKEEHCDGQPCCCHARGLSQQRAIHKRIQSMTRNACQPRLQFIRTTNKRLIAHVENSR